MVLKVGPESIPEGKSQIRGPLGVRKRVLRVLQQVEGESIAKTKYTILIN